MATWNVKINGKGVRKDQVLKLAEAMKEKFGDGVSIGISDASPPESRADRFAAAKTLAANAKSEVEDLKSELEDWLGNMPENLQDGDKGQEIQTAIDELDSVCNSLDESQTEVNFPGMY